ncbi:MAG: glycosyltransferase [Chitinophagaceae bacterium]|nr:MAG: glycosyltransferase [Chitinophagaceae bacterium]
MKYRSFVLKRKIEAVAIQPFVWIGRLIAALSPAARQYSHVYFFPFYHIGGAEKLHYQIAQATGGPDCIIYFTRKSNSTFFLDEFRKSGCEIRDISKLTDNKFLYFLNLVMRGVISHRINRQPKRPVVFNGQSNFGYKISPWIGSAVPQIELIHALNTFSLIRLPFLSFYTRSITVSQEIVDKHRILYQDKEVPLYAWQKFSYISSKVKLPVEKKYRSDSEAKPFVVLYVGRATDEKRPWIASAVAKALAQGNDQYRFEFAGEVAARIPQDEKRFCHFHGDVQDEEILGRLYASSHLLIIPSLSESGPLVLMEAMARGAVVISTPVGIVNLHLKNGISGFVINALSTDQEVAAELTLYIEKLYRNREELARISEYSVDYAFEHFDLSTLAREYQDLFYSLTPGT